MRKMCLTKPAATRIVTYFCNALSLICIPCFHIVSSFVPEPSVPYLARPTLPEDEDVADQTSKKVTFAAGTKETGMMTEEEEEERPSRVQGRHL